MLGLVTFASYGLLLAVADRGDLLTTTTRKQQPTMNIITTFAVGVPMALLSQCAPASPGCAPAPPAPVTAPAPERAVTMSMRQAQESAADYIKYVGGFSRLGLIDQLLYEGFSQLDAEYGVDIANTDWFAQAAESAADYIEYVGGFSRRSLIDQLLYEEFTPEQAEHGVNSVGL